MHEYSDFGDICEYKCRLTIDIRAFHLSLRQLEPKKYCLVTLKKMPKSSTLYNCTLFFNDI